MATKLCTAAPNICWTSARNLLHIIFLVTRNLRWHLDVCKVCAALRMATVILERVQINSHLIYYNNNNNNNRWHQKKKKVLARAARLSAELYRGADKSLDRSTSRCILFDGENISFDASLVIYIYMNSMNIPPIMIINRIYETQNLLSL